LQNKTKLYCWACDFKNNTGEGNLARLFIKKEYTLSKYRVFTLNGNKILNYKYLSPLIGILFCWYFFITRKKTVYLNYLPLWNFLLFIILPPNTIFGPITGGAFYKKKNILRKFFFPFFYKISEIFLNLRNIKIYFSTELLKQYLSKKTIERSSFNYVLNYYKKRNTQPKIIDFLIYYRTHKNKESFFPYNLIKILVQLNYKVHIVGDFLKNFLVFNHGKLNNDNINKLLSRTYFSIASEENIYSIFTMECINNGVKILADTQQKSKIKFFKKNFIILNFKNRFELNKLKDKNIIFSKN
jgi:hypothetical protein